MAHERVIVGQSLVPLLDGGNYEVWKMKMRGLLMKEDLWSVTMQPKPETGDSSWERANCRALGCITLSLGNDQTVHIARCETAHEAWQTLQQVNEPSSYGSRLYLRRKLYSFRYVSVPMQSHVTSMLQVIEQLRGAGVELAVGDQIAALLNSLPESYSALVISLERGLRLTDLTVDYVCGHIQDEYIRRMENKKTTGVERNVQDVALCLSASGSRQLQQRPKSFRSNKGIRSEDRQCYVCGKRGHIRRNCPGVQEKSNKVTNEKADNVCFVFFSRTN
ncbi:hypothetical protein M514_20777 [Trichuris suis]|uniref:CCHC-type domain-containing protein n=1 Tax=Trichuris suis TaxID=68888 RepID=A0A085NBR5_9BILA|nr:hypothetical protein M514_20777 [Trichuris suis]